MTKLRIKEICKAQGITQATLAGRLGIKPISFSQAIARNNFDMEYLGRIASALGVDITELFRKPEQFVALIKYNGELLGFDSVSELKQWANSLGEQD